MLFFILKKLGANVRVFPETSDLLSPFLQIKKRGQKFGKRVGNSKKIMYFCNLHIFYKNIDNQLINHYTNERRKLTFVRRVETVLH